jgi:O-antigen ligase
MMFLNSLTYINKNIFFLIGLYPLALILGTAVSEFLNFVLIIFFIFICIKNKNFNFVKSKLFLSFSLVWFYLLLNFLINESNIGLLRSFFFIRYGILIFAIQYYLSLNNNLTNVLKTWLVSIFIIIFDIFFESIFGFNTLGFQSPWNERIVSFLYDELKIAHILIGFSLIPIVYFFNKKPFFFIFFIFLFIFATFLTGERANTIRAIFIILTFAFIFYKKFKTKILAIVTIFSLLVSFVIFNPTMHQRFYIEIKNNIQNHKTLFNVIKKSNYGPHYDTAIKIFENNKFFGTGMKSFRYECKKINNGKGCSTHPHQLYFEILSELGLIGFFILSQFFITLIAIAFKNFKKNKNILIIPPLLFIMSMILPLLPSGSFFTSFGSTIFWVNIGVLTFYADKK